MTLEVILRVVFGVAGPRARPPRGMLDDRPAEDRLALTQLIGLATRRLRGRPLGRFEGQLKASRDLLFAEIAEHRPKDDLEEREDILSLLILAGSRTASR